MVLKVSEPLKFYCSYDYFETNAGGEYVHGDIFSPVSACVISGPVALGILLEY